MCLGQMMSRLETGEDGMQPLQRTALGLVCRRARRMSMVGLPERQRIDN